MSYLCIASRAAKAVLSFGFISIVGCAAQVSDSETEAWLESEDEGVAVTTQALEANPSIVISQVFGGGYATAPYRSDFVELYNRGDHPVSLAGWSIQYAAATGTGTIGQTPTQRASLPNVTLQPGRYFLVQLYTTGGTPLPTPDAFGSINLSHTSGKVALARVTTAIGCNGSSVPCSAAQLANMIDFVGYGTANFYEGAGAAPLLSGDTAIQRLFGGCLFGDSNNNNNDFVLTAPQPRNTTVVQPCNLAGTTP